MNNKNKDSRILKCQHVSLEVSDVNVSLEFYRKFLNMKLTERHRAGEHKDIPFEMAFLRLNKQHHDLVLTHNPNRKYTKKMMRILLLVFTILPLNALLGIVFYFIYQKLKK